MWSGKFSYRVLLSVPCTKKGRKATLQLLNEVFIQKRNKFFEE
jgi:hypothetical protein